MIMAHDPDRDLDCERRYSVRRGRDFDPGVPVATESRWASMLDGVDPPPWERGRPGRLVVIAAHPDDETLGAGGLIHDLSARGWRATVVAVTDGEAAYGRDDPGRVERLRRVRPLEQSRAVFRLSPDAETIRLGLPDGEVAGCESLLTAALAAVASHASLLLTTWRHDGHSDHEAVADVTARVADASGVPMAQFPIWAWYSDPTEIRRSSLRAWRMSTEALQAKRIALRAFASQMSVVDGLPVPPPHVTARVLCPVEAFIV
jgi:LmbE family N-acetylglucosaminyl deacetylase